MSELDSEEEKVIPHAVGWLATNFFQGSRQNLLVWVGAFLGFEAQKVLRKQLYLDNNDRIQAEQQLIAFLKTDPKRPKGKFRQETRLGRHTDWGKTAFVQQTIGPNIYVNRKIELEPDFFLLSSLFNLARRWLRELETFAEYKNSQRLENLEQACREICFQPLNVYYDANIAERLKLCRNGKTLVQLIEQSRSVLAKKYDSETDGKRLIELFNKFHLDTVSFQDNSETTNGDLLLEMIATVSLAKAFCQLGWKPNIQYSVDIWSFSESINLVKNEVTLKIQKGFPKSSNGSNIDRTIPILHTIIGHNANGKQPDIVMQFTYNGKSVYLIGDAKRNQTGDGSGYRRTAFFSMLNDFVAFGHRLGLSIGTEKTGFFKATIQPSGLLFFKQYSADSVDQTSKIEVITAFGFNEYGNGIFSDSIATDNRLISTLKHIQKSVFDVFSLSEFE